MSELAQDLLLLGLRPERGRVRLGAYAGKLLSAALVADLVLAGGVEATGEGRETRIVLTDAQATSEPVQREALQWIEKCFGPLSSQDEAELAAAGWLTRKVVGWTMKREGVWPTLDSVLVGFGTERRIVDHLVSTGVLTRHEHRRLGLFATERLALVSSRHRDELVAEVRAVLVEGREPDQRTGPLLALLGGGLVLAGTSNGAPHLARLVPLGRRGKASERAKGFADVDWDDSGGVRRVLQAAVAIIKHEDYKSSDYSAS